MQADKRNPNPKLPSRVHGVDHADKSRNVYGPVWEFIFHTLDDYFGRVRKVDHEPHKSNVANQPAEPGQPHKCERHNERNCNCASGTCADDDGGAGDGNPFEQHRQQYRDQQRIHTPEPNQYGNFRCPVSGQLCSSNVCREWCEGSGSGATLGVDRRSAKAAKYYRNIDSETGAS